MMIISYNYNLRLIFQSFIKREFDEMKEENHFANDKRIFNFFDYIIVL